MPRQHADRKPRDCKSLLRAVCDSPDEDAPRLAYAKCLEETGDRNDAIRAEYIRVQCELKQSDLPDERWEELDARKEALERHCEGWAATELPKLDGIRWNDIAYRRGFVWDVWCDDEEAFRRHASTIFAAAPIQSLSFMRLRSLKLVVEVPEFSRVRRLILEDLRLRPSDALALAESPNVRNLTALHLSNNRLGDAGARAIAASPYLRRLDNLDLGHNGVSDDGVTALASSPVVSSLSHLGLGGNPLTNIGALALAASALFTRLAGMTLWECRKIGVKGKQALKARFSDVVSFVD